MLTIVLNMSIEHTIRQSLGIIMQNLNVIIKTYCDEIF